jgi:hypothetical protein
VKRWQSEGTGVYTRAMTQRRPALLVLALLLGVVGGACRTQTTEVDSPAEGPIVALGEQVDAPAVCTAGCKRLARCVPELAGDLDGDPSVVAERLAVECESACEGFADQRSSQALRDCLTLNSCTAFWGCVGATEARPWLAVVAPVGERTCANLCSQASSCAIAKVCETGARKGRPGKDAEANELVLDPECMRDELLRNELEERCLLQCQALPDDSRARTELIGCIDHASCGGLLSCLDGWAATPYTDASGPTPGISPSCDGFCTRAILCGADDEFVELEPHELDHLKRLMTSTYVECAVQCQKDLEVGGETAEAAFDKCTAVETCDEFAKCADEV